MSYTKSLLNLDFASLRTFQLVHQLGSFSDAADSLDVKQSTVSYTIDRIRKVVDDPLFVRVGGRIQETERCKELIPLVKKLLVDAENMLPADRIDPAEYSGDFTIASASYATKSILPGVMRRIRRYAPNMHVILRTGYSDTIESFFDEGADIVITAGHSTESGIYAQPLIEDDYPVCVMNKANPLVGKTLSMEDVKEASFVLPRPYRSFKGAFLREIERRNLKLRVAFTATEVSDIPDIVMGTDLIGPMPLGMAHAFLDTVGFAKFPFVVNTTLTMYWSAISHRSQMNVAVRGWIAEAAKESKGTLPF